MRKFSVSKNGKGVKFFHVIRDKVYSEFILDFRGFTMYVKYGQYKPKDGSFSYVDFCGKFKSEV